MNASELRYQIESTGREPHFFSRKTMQFFGDTMRNFGVRRVWIESDGKMIDAWELYRRRSVKHGIQSSHYFDCATFRRITR